MPEAPSPLPGDFAVARMDGHAARLIRIGQWLNGDGFADYEHAFVYVGDGHLVEAQPGGAELRPLSAYNNRHVLWSTGRYDLTDQQRSDITAAAHRYIGTPYSVADYFALAAHRFRLPIGPALLVLAGRWNWWPGSRMRCTADGFNSPGQPERLQSTRNRCVDVALDGAIQTDRCVDENPM